MQITSTAKEELIELIDLQESYPMTHPQGRTLARDPMAELPGNTPRPPLSDRLKALLPLLMAAYGGTLSSPDQSLLRLLLHINDVITQSPDWQAAAASDHSASGSASVPAAAAIGEGGQAFQGIAEAAEQAADGHEQEDEEQAEVGPIHALLRGPLAQAG